MKELFVLLSFLLAFGSGSFVLREGYELVNGLPVNKNVPRDVVYPFCVEYDADFRACDCMQGEMDYLPTYTCHELASIEDLVAFFARTFPTYLVRNITISKSRFTTIPANVFADKQPERISVYDTGITYIDPEAFVNAKDTLRFLEIEYNPDLQDFPFASMNELVNLEVLNLDANNIHSLSGISDMRMSKLLSFDINFNPNAGELPVFPFFAQLGRFSARGSGLTSIPKDRPFYGLQVLETLILSNNSFDVIGTKTFEFNALNVKTVDLSHCNITIMDADAFSGINSNTEILLSGNGLTTLSADVFRPILEMLSTGAGVLDVTDNPIACCCEINWLINDATIQKALRGGRCAGGALISGLPLEYLTPLCPALV